MTCAQIQVLIGVYAELDAPTRRLLDRHVRGCATCAAAWHDEAAFRRLMLERRDPQPRPGLEARLLAVANRDTAWPPPRAGRPDPAPALGRSMAGSHGRALSRWLTAGLTVAAIGIGAWRITARPGHDADPTAGPAEGAVPGPAGGPMAGRAAAIARVGDPMLAPAADDTARARSADGVGGTGDHRRGAAAARERTASLPGVPARPAASPASPVLMPAGPTTPPVPPTPSADRAPAGAARPPDTQPAAGAPPTPSAEAPTAAPTPSPTAAARLLALRVEAEDPALALDGKQAAVLIEAAAGDGWTPVYEELLAFSGPIAEGRAALDAPPPYAVELLGVPAPAVLCPGEARRRVLTAADVDAAVGIVRFRLCAAAPAATEAPAATPEAPALAADGGR